MPDPTQPTSPAPAGPAAAAGSPASAAPAAAAPTTPAIDLNAVLAENKRIAAERDRALSQNREVRKFATQKSQEAAALRRQLEGRADADATSELSFDEPAPQAPARRSEPDSEILADLAEVKFKQNTPDWNEVVDKQTGRTVWDEMNSILFDDAQANDYAGRTPYLTLKNIHREVQYRRLVSAQKAGADALAAADASRGTVRARAAMSGQSGGGEEEIDVSQMTPQQMVDAGLVEFDPNNPPSHARGSLFKEQ